MARWGPPSYSCPTPSGRPSPGLPALSPTLTPVPPHPGQRLSQPAGQHHRQLHPRAGCGRQLPSEQEGEWGRGGAGAGQRDVACGPTLTRWPCLQSTCLFHAPAPSTLSQPPYCKHSSLGDHLASAKLLGLGLCLLLDASPLLLLLRSVLGPRGPAPWNWPTLSPSGGSFLPAASAGVFFLPLSSFRPLFQKHFLKEALLTPLPVRPSCPMARSPSGPHGPCHGV